MRAAESACPDKAADQAAGLRRLIAARDPGMLALSGADAGSYAPLALDLAAASERDGRRVLLLDLTRGALARRLGRTMRYELMHVIDAHKRLDEVVVAGPRDVPLLPAARGVRALANAWRGCSRFADFVERAGGAPQLVLAVAPAEELEMLAQLAAFATLVVVGPEGGADLKTCYAALKRAHAIGAAAPRLIYAGGLDADAARRAHARLIETSRAFLGGEPELVGRLVVDRMCERQTAAAQRSFPCLSVEQLSRAIVRWPLPPMVAGTSTRSAPRLAARGAKSVSP
jgi:hypothetical protein